MEHGWRHGGNIHLQDIAKYPPERRFQYPWWISTSWDPAQPRCSSQSLRQSLSTSAGTQWGQMSPWECRQLPNIFENVKPKQVWMPLPVNHRRIMGKTGDNGGLHIVAFPEKRECVKKKWSWLKITTCQWYFLQTQYFLRRPWHPRWSAGNCWHQPEVRA